MPWLSAAAPGNGGASRPSPKVLLKNGARGLRSVATFLPARLRGFFADLGPGLITGAADDDPSGISTYSVTGAAFGYAQLWTALFSFPLMVAVQLMCSRLGMVTGRGLAGYTNGEVIRNPEAGQSPYLARAFLRATIPLGGDSEEQEPDLLEVGGQIPARRLVLTGGVLAAADLFDTNRYANSTRTQFLNWSFINNPAWDFAADTRGYTRGDAVEWIDAGWTVRLGAFQMPEVANGLDLDGDLLHNHGDQIELEVHPTVLANRQTILRALAYENYARMGRYREALAVAARTGGYPTSRRRGDPVPGSTGSR